jgi:hypothetical protein
MCIRKTVAVAATLWLAASCAGPREARASARWGYELALQSDLSRTRIIFEPERRIFPLSGSVTGTVRVPAGQRFAFVSGAGYENRVQTEHYQVTLDDGFGGTPPTIEFTRQDRYQSSVVPLAFELELPRSWRVAAGGEWRHLFRETSRLKRGAINGERVVDPKLESWAEGTSAFLTDQYAATLELAKLWSGPGGTRSLSLRWVEGLQDLLPSPYAEIRHRALQLVVGWER